ncbi:MAG: leucine-rich repeat domain-containing protein, partial [Paludibacteraceae bacterium]|nr:leucine-rich repeat domain-containing protein [Paludibacteraceae bacterium]
PNSVTTIGSYAFQYCTGLTSVTIPNSVTTIGSYAFSNCNALKSISIPSTVSTIGKDAFYKIGTVYYDGNATGSPWSAYRHIKENFVYGNFAYANERKDSLLAYICADTRVTIPASVVYIGNYVFYGCENISSVCIPNSVTEIGSVAFYNVDTVFFGGNLYGSPWGAKTQIKGNVIDGNFVYLDEEKTNLSAYLGTDSVVNIPNQVKIIGRYVFENNKKITSVTIPNSVTTIGYSAFSGCTGLKSVIIPNSVTTIEEFAFSNCTGLTSVTIPNSVTTIGYSAFRGCTGLKSVIIPNSVTTIEEFAFSNCTGLTSVTIPNSVTTIGYSAFSGCTGVNSVTIPNSVTTIGSKAFYNVGAIIYEGDATGSPWGAKCHMKEDYIDGDFVYADEQKTKLISYIGSDTAVVIPNQVISIGEKAFYDKTGVKSVTIPNSVTTIGSDAFYNVGAILYEGDATGSPWGAKYHITEGYVDGDFVYADEQKTELISYIGSDAAVVIPNQVKSIGEKAFYNKTGVKSVSIPNSVTSINYSAFSGCTGLTSVTIPNSVTYIGHSAFSGCTGLKSVTIPNSVTSINYSAFSGCTGLTSVTIPNSVTSIGSYEFSGCTSLKSVTIPSSVTSIERYAFSGCTSLKSVTIPSSVTSIGNSAFSGADTIYYAGTATGSPWGAKRHIRGAYSDGDFVYADEQKTRLTDYVGSATAVVIPEQVESIEPMTFSNNTKLTMVTIPSSVTSIGYSAFSGCTGLTAVTIPNTITTIEFGTFSGCTGLTSVTIPNSVTSIDYSVFSGCTGLTSVTLPDSLVFIGREAFSGCANLKDISLPNTVSSIGTRAFQRCTSLDTIVLPNSLTYIDQLVFYECSALSSVTIPNSVTSIDWVAFQGCSMKSVSVPNSVTSIDGGAFYGTDTIYYGGPASGANWGAKHRGKIPDGDFIYADKEKESVIGYIGSNSEVVIPKQVKYIADSAFYNHGELTAVFLHDSVKCINKSAFEGCTGLRSIHIPNSVVTVGKSAFRGIDTVCYLVESDTIRIIKDTLFIHDVKEFNFYRALTPKSVIPNGKLETDLDLSSICGIIDGETASWESIVLTGASFDGGNHSISNLYINQPNGKAALFTGYDILISNLKLKNAYIKGGYAYGFMYGDGVYYNCHFDGVLTGDWCAVFTGKGATAVNCSNYGMVIANKYAYFMDGQYAYNCYNRGSVLSLEGSAQTYFTSATNCYNAGEVMGAKGSKAFGYDPIHCFNLKIDNYSDGACQLDSLAFLSGAVTDSLNEYVLQNPKIKNYYLLDSVPLFSWVQGEDGFPRFEDVDLKPTQGYVVHFTGVVDDVHITKTGTIDLPVCPIDGHTYIFSNNFDGKNIVSDTTITVGIIENLDFLERDKDGFYLIHNGRELALFRDVVNDGAAIINARLTNDIDLDEECKDSVWTPIGIYSYKGSKLAFEGVFDGAGYSIEHLYDISDSPYEGVATHWYRGLFGYAKNALIQNVVVKNSRITGFCVAAIVAVSDNTTIANCGSEAELYGYSDYGAASMCAYSCGQDRHLSVLNCYNLGEVKGEYQAYAIASYSRNELSEFENCYSSANIFWDYRSSDGEQGQFCADGKCTRCFTDSVLCNQKEIEGVTKTSTERIKSDAFLADMNAWVDSMNTVQSKIVFAHWVRDKVDEYPKLRPVSSSSVLSDNPSIANDGISVYAVDGTIYIRSAHAGKTNLYDIHGKAVASVVYTEGVTTVDGLQKGVYILCGVKMMIR